MESFDWTELVSTEQHVDGWIPGSCALFRLAAEWAQDRGLDFLFLEPDAVPLRMYWLNDISQAYGEQRKQKPFMGSLVPHMQPGWPNPYFEGVGVYPFDAWKRIRSHFKPNETWTRSCAPAVVPHATNSPLFHHLWGEHGLPPSFTKEGVPGTNILPLTKLNPCAAVFHRNKDFSLANLLRIKNGMKVDLEPVTLWTIVWGETPTMGNRALRVVRFCEKHFYFKETVIFASRHVPLLSGGCRWRIAPVDCMSFDQFNRIINETVPHFINTDFAMAVQEDGFPTSPELWTNRFLTYDYIGAPWTDGTVGNGGFYLESRRMLSSKLKLPKNLGHPAVNADMWLCRTHRHTLQQMGVNFAPRDLAARFSTEATDHGRPSFGFHGRKYNPVRYAQGWKQIEDSEK